MGSEGQKVRADSSIQGTGDGQEEGGHRKASESSHPFVGKRRSSLRRCYKFKPKAVGFNSHN